MSEKFWDIILNSSTFKELSRDIESESIAHAYLLCSGDNLSLDILAANFIERTTYGGIAARIMQNTAPDIITLPLDSDKVKILTEDIDYAVNNAYITPTELEYKYFIINFADTMNDTCQNKLLKTLEEPPKSSRFILKCNNLNKILPTVKSRCRIVELKEFTISEMENELKKYYKDDKSLVLAANLSNGMIGFADKIVNDKITKKLFDDVLDTLEHMLKSSDILYYAAKLLAYKDRLGEILDYIELILHDIVIHLSNAEKLQPFIDKEKIENLSREFSIEVIINISPLLLKARRKASLNGNINGIIDQLLFGILEEKAKCKK